MQKNSITNKITPCCGLPFSVIYWWVSNLTLNSESDRQFILSKISQNGIISIDGWKVLVNSGTLETDAVLTKAEFLAWFDCGKQPNCEQLKLIIEGFKISNYTPEGGVNYITNNIYQFDAEQIVPSEALYNDTSSTLAGDVLKRVDINTGEDVNYREATTWYDGSPMDDTKVDGVIFIKKNNKYYKRCYDYQINVKWFGAKGDGITDDTQAIQNALNACYGSELYFPPSSGAYVVSDTLFIKANLNSKISILMKSGGSQRSCIKLNDTFLSNKAVFKAENILVGCVIDGLTITNNSGRKAIGLELVNCRGFRIKDVLFINLNKAISYGVDCYYNVLKDFEFYNCEYGVKIESGYPIGSLKISDGKITSCKYAIQSDGNCNDVILSNVDLEGCEYKVFLNDGEIVLRDCYLGDESVTPVVVNGGYLTIDNPTSLIGSALTGVFKSVDDTNYRQGVLLTGGVLKLTNCTVGGNFVDSTNQSGNCIGSSIRVMGGKLIGHFLKFDKAEKNVIDAVNLNNIYLDEFNNYVKNGCLRNGDLTMIEKNIVSEGYNIDCVLEYLTDKNINGGNILRVKPSADSNKYFGFQIPYKVDNIEEVKFIRLKFRPYRDFSESESTYISSNFIPAVKVIGSTQFSNEEAEENGFIMSYPSNQNWAGYYFGRKIQSTNSYSSQFVQEVVFPVIMTQKEGYLRIANLISLSSSNIGDPNYIDFGIDFYHIAIVDKLGGEVICNFKDGF